MSDFIDKIRFDAEIATDYFSEKLAFTLGPVELKKMLAAKKVKLIDVRLKEDYDEGHIPEAISIPKAGLIDNLALIDKKDVHVIYCYNQQCHLGASAALVLAQNHYPVMELEGGFKTWAEDFKFEVVK